MDKNKNDNRIQQNESLSKGKANQVIISKSSKFKKVLLAIAVITTTAGAYAQTNDLNNTKSQDIQNKNTLDKQNSNMKHPDGYMMQNGKLVVIKNGVITPLDKDATLSNGTTIYRDGSYLLKGGSKTMFKEGEHMDMDGKIIPMNKWNNNNKSGTEKSLKKDTMYLINDSTKNKKR